MERVPKMDVAGVAHSQSDVLEIETRKGDVMYVFQVKVGLALPSPIRSGHHDSVFRFGDQHQRLGRGEVLDVAE